MSNLNGVAGEIAGQLVTNLFNRFAPFVDKTETYYNIIKALKDTEITLDQIQCLANQEVRVLPLAPVMPANNGKEATKDVPPLAEPVAEEQPREVKA